MQDKAFGDRLGLGLGLGLVIDIGHFITPAYCCRSGELCSSLCLKFERVGVSSVVEGLRVSKPVEPCHEFLAKYCLYRSNHAGIITLIRTRLLTISLFAFETAQCGHE